MDKFGIFCYLSADTDMTRIKLTAANASAEML